MKIPLIRQAVRSEALDAYRAKDRDAKKRLGRHFIAYVRVKRGAGKHPVRGYIVYATDNHLARYVTDLFSAYIVGNPDLVVKDIRDTFQFAHEHSVELTDDADVHGTVVLTILKEYNKSVIEDKDEPRANAVEILLFDAVGDIYWCSYDGNYDGQPARGRGNKRVIFRGCYDRAANRAVRRILYGLGRGCPDKAKLRRAVRAIRKATRLPNVGTVVVR